MRAIARDLYEATRELPLICPHGHVDPRRLSSRRAVRRPGEPARHLGPLRDAAAARERRRTRATSASAGEALSEERRAKHVAAALRSLGRSSAARAVALLARARARRHVRHLGAAIAARPPTRSTTRSLRASPSTRSGRAPCYERFGVEVLATTDDPCDDLAAHARARGRPVLGGPRDPDIPPRPVSRAGAARLGATRLPRSPRRRGRHGRLRRLPRGAGAAAAALRRARRDRRRPRPRRCPHRAARPCRCRRGSTGRRSPARRTAAEAVAFRRHMLFEMARMSCEDGLVMTLHPGVLRGHHAPTGARLRPGHRA